jgi:hypothetical protein
VTARAPARRGRDRRCRTSASPTAAGASARDRSLGRVRRHDRRRDAAADKQARSRAGARIR